MVNPGDRAEGAGAPKTVRFGGYRLLEKVAEGGMAEIFLAKAFPEAGRERIVAIKRILPARQQDPSYVEMFKDEAQMVGQLVHPNIAQIYQGNFLAA